LNLLIFILLLAFVFLFAGLVLKYGMAKKLKSRDDDAGLREAYNKWQVQHPEFSPLPGGGIAGSITTPAGLPALSYPVANAQDVRPKISCRGKFDLLNSAETRLYATLLAAFPKMIPFPKVGMAQLFLIPENEIGRQLENTGLLSVDFLICKKHDDKITIAMAVELDNPDPVEEASRRRHEKKRRILKEAGFPLLVYETSGLPDVNTLRRDATLAIEAKKREKRSEKTPENPKETIAPAR
jgi:hypothetical protein